VAFVTAALLVGCAGGSIQTASQTPVATKGAVAPVVTKGAVALIVAPPAVTRFLHAGVHARAPVGNAAPEGNGKFVATLQAYGSDADVYQVITIPAARPQGHHHPSGPYLSFLSSFTTALSAPYGTAITPSGTWYIANSGAANVPVFTISSSGVVTGPIETLSVPGGLPVDVDANATGSLVAVSNYANPSGVGSIELYVGGSTTPTRTLSVTGPAFGIAVALDKAGNCYWSYNTNPSTGGPGEIVEFVKCRGAAKPIAAVGFAGGLAFNEANDLFYVDQDAQAVYRCVGNASCHVLASGFGDPWGINFDSGWKHLWLTDLAGTIFALNQKTGAILSSTPAEGGESDPPFGVAAAPGPKY
jgi:hypothetical protein